MDIPTSSDDFDKYIESQIELAKLNNNLTDRITDYDEAEDRRKRKELIDSIIFIQNPSVNEKKVAYFEYNNGNSEITKKNISIIIQTFNEKQDRETTISIENIQQKLVGYDIPEEIAKELAILILKDKIID